MQGNSKTETTYNTNIKLKRDVNYNTFTAKDVGALEVIVDLLKNANDYKETFEMSSPKNFQIAEYASNNRQTEQKPNSIQVHIVIPYDIPDNKRSLDPIKVRKVFTAKMATPVDLEYQINSIEDSSVTNSDYNLPSTSTSFTYLNVDYGLSPGIYLLVDSANNVEGSFALKPVNVPSAEIRHNDDETTEKVEEQTKTGKVPLSTEFLAALNNLLIQLYKNIQLENKDGTQCKRHKVTKREINWGNVIKLFENDRACNCKRKPNETICKACAASDAVIKELSYEFDNLAKYMSTHCTEIQTFFAKNPSASKVLEDCVRRIDKSLNDYYNKVKTKCRGCTCRSFATFIDKRGFNKNNEVGKNYTVEPLIDDLKSLHANFDVASNLIPFDETLKEKGDQLVTAANKCMAKLIRKKRLTDDTNNKQKNDKRCYSLDNISVNIVCSPNAINKRINTGLTHFIETPVMNSVNILLDYDTSNKNSKKNYLKKIFKGKKRLKLNKLSYFKDHVTTVNSFKKREAKYNQIESPLIADTGGSFWHDYLNKAHKNVKSDNSKPNLEISVVQMSTENTPTITGMNPTELFKDKLKKMDTTKRLTTLQSLIQLDTSSKKDSLGHIMNKLFRLIGTINIFKEANVENTASYPIQSQYSTSEMNTKKIKTKKHKIHKVSIAKMHHKHKIKTFPTTDDIRSTNLFNTTTNDITNIDINKLNEIKTTNKVSEDTKTINSNSIKGSTASDTKTKIKQTTTAVHVIPTKKRNLFDKIKMATFGFQSITGKEKSVLDLKTAKDGTNGGRLDRPANDKSIKGFTMDAQKYVEVGTNFKAEATTNMNPTILIIDNDLVKYADKREENIKSRKYKNLLLSIINYATDKLNNEKQSLNEENIENKNLYEADLIDNLSKKDVNDIELRVKEVKAKQ